MRVVLRALALGLFLCLLRPAPGHAQEDASPSVEVLLLGTVHLDNPGRDVNNPTVPDVLLPEKQAELAALRDSLAQFRPTKMAIEVRRRHQAAIDSLYRRFRAGRMDTSFVGADVVAQYHKRNLRIFANLAQIAEPGDRIIGIFGNGHMPYLRPLVEASPKLRFVDPLRYL